MPRANLDKLFNATSIAIFGVSTDVNKLGYVIFSNIQSAGFSGKLFPINPKYPDIYGEKCYPDLQSIPEDVDTVIMAVPASLTIEVIQACATKAVKNLVVISAGYSETGEEGKKLETELYRLANEAGINVLGPNCLGYINTKGKINASFAPFVPAEGQIAFASQSGAVCTALLDMAAVDNLGFAQFVSLGNKGSINENDLLERWLIDPEIKVIGFYLEEFSDGLNFIRLKEQLKQEKPIVVINPGLSSSAQAAISSHTGSLASPAIVTEAALAKYGMTQVQDINDLYNLLEYFTWGKLPAGKRVGVITNAGGAGIIATDLLESHGLELSELSDEIQKELKEKLPLTASTRNPVDVIGDAPADRYYHALQVLEGAETVDIIMLLLSPQLVTEIEDTAKLVISLSKHSAKPVVPVFIGGKYVQQGLQRLRDNHIAAFTSLNSAVQTLQQVVTYSEFLKARPGQITISDLQPQARNIDLKVSSELTTVSESLVNGLMQQFEIPMPKSVLSANLEEVLQFWNGLGGRQIVVKATTELAIHKTDVKGIYTNLNSEMDIRKSFSLLQEQFAATLQRPASEIVLLAQEQIPEAEEIYVGIKRDGGADVYSDLGKGFGHLMLLGKGGIYTEIYADIASALLPLDLRDLELLLGRTKVARIIAGARGKQPLAKDKLFEVLLKLQRLVLTYPEIKEIDINPMMLTESECVVVDAKLFVSN